MDAVPSTAAYGPRRRLCAVPAVRDAQAGRLRLGRSRRRPDARRRGAGVPGGPGRRRRSRARRASCSSDCSQVSASIATTSTSRTSSSAGRRRIATRSSPRSRSCEPHLFRQIELVRPRVVATLGNFATRLLSGRPSGITQVHGQEHEVALGGTTVVLFPLYHPAAALYTPVDAAGAGGRLRATAGSPRPGAVAAAAVRAAVPTSCRLRVGDEAVAVGATSSSGSSDP